MLTHINVAFEFVFAAHKISNDVGVIAGRVSRLESIYPDLKVKNAIGGWTFNDPPTATLFSDMVSTVLNREMFIKSLIRYMQKYSLDVLILVWLSPCTWSLLMATYHVITDWEYPVADDRGGKIEDYDNLVLLVAYIQEAFDSYNPCWEITMTLPSSFWYL